MLSLALWILIGAARVVAATVSERKPGRDQVLLGAEAQRRVKGGVRVDA